MAQTIDRDEEFYAVPLGWEESDKLIHIELELSEATKKRLGLTSTPVILEQISKGRSLRADVAGGFPYWPKLLRSYFGASSAEVGISNCQS